ncbi:hypothetical protein Tco_1577926, partial [Tanacetum coccineum]
MTSAFMFGEKQLSRSRVDEQPSRVESRSSRVHKTAESQMACVAPRSHGGDAGGDPPRRPTGPVPAQCQ